MAARVRLKATGLSGVPLWCSAPHLAPVPTWPILPQVVSITEGGVAGVIDVGRRFRYCSLSHNHPGEHRDHTGDTWTNGQEKAS